MALPRQKPESSVQAERRASPQSRGDASRSGGEEFVATPSPARRLQSLLESEMQVRRAPSVKRSLTVVLVLSLACSVAALSLFNLGLN